MFFLFLFFVPPVFHLGISTRGGQKGHIPKEQQPGAEIHGVLPPWIKCPVHTGHIPNPCPQLVVLEVTALKRSQRGSQQRTNPQPHATSTMAQGPGAPSCPWIFLTGSPRTPTLLLGAGRSLCPGNSHPQPHSPHPAEPCHVSVSLVSRSSFLLVGSCSVSLICSGKRVSCVGKEK